MRPVAAFAQALLIIIVNSQKASPAAGDGMNHGSWTKICGLADKLGKVPKAATTKLTETVQLAQRLSNTVTRCAIFAMKTADAEKARQARILQVFFATKAEKTLNDLTSVAIETAIKASSSAEYFQGRLTEFLTIATHTIRGNKCCLLDGSNRGHYHATKLQGAGGVTCDLTATIDITGDYSLDLTNNNGFANSIVPGNAKSHQSTPTKECPLFEAHNSNGLAEQGALSQPAKLAMNLISDSETNNALTILGLAKAKTEKAGDNKAWHDLYNPIDALKTLNPKRHDNATVSEATADLQAAVLQLIHAMTDKGSLDLDNEVKKAFKEPVKDKIQALIHEVYSYKLRMKIINNGEETELRTVTDPGKLAAILAFCEKEEADLISKLRKELTVARLSASNNNLGETECNKIKDANECNDKPFCSYNSTETEENKKCKFNATKSTANGVPVTQSETGGTERTAEKCKDNKLEPDCTKAPECKLEGNTCNNSSSLVNKKLALKAAGFVSLIPF
uniref:Variant surface glycoprotein 1125.4148 n=1 Tax=Trypanosoma brucei TaxID=5691 RepID=A0A1J0R9X5_9TRYP|nr:variant surface glycoprotein 1125.4148 [Trypanosoma brucei]